MLKGVKSLPVWLAVLLALAIGGYWYYWQRVAEKLPHQVEAWIAQQSRDGVHFSHQGIEIRGFPARFEIHLDGPAMEVTRANRHFRWQGNNLIAVMQSWNFNHMILDVVGENRLTLKSGEEHRDITLNAERFMASARMDKMGKMLVLAVDMENAELQGQTPVSKFARSQLHIRMNRGENEERPDGSMHVASLTDDLQLALPDPVLGKSIDRINLATFLNHVPDGLTPDALDIWRENGGVVDIRGLELQFSGIDISGNATLAVDAKRRLEGAGVLKLRETGRLLDAMQNGGHLNSAVTLGLKLAAEALEKTPEKGEDLRPFVEVPFSVLDGSISVAGFSVSRVTPLY